MCKKREPNFFSSLFYLLICNFNSYLYTLYLLLSCCCCTGNLLIKCIYRLIIHFRFFHRSAGLIHIVSRISNPHNKRCCYAHLQSLLAIFSLRMTFFLFAFSSLYLSTFAWLIIQMLLVYVRFSYCSTSHAFAQPDFTIKA